MSYHLSICLSVNTVIMVTVMCNEHIHIHLLLKKRTTGFLDIYVEGFQI